MTVRASIVIERSYKASLQDIWDLWTTKEGFESWWGPVEFFVRVHKIEPHVGGALHYDMVAGTPQAVDAMAELERPGSHETRGTFIEVEPLKALAITHIIDFIPGVPPYNSTIRVQLLPVGDTVRMITTLSPMHDDATSGMQSEGYTSQLSKLDARFGG